jgi:pimeloyl-ACP methyl ester carboxylesterase
MRPLIVLLALALPAIAERVTFKSDDGVEIVGTWQAAGKDAPTVICLPMFRNVRKSYQPLMGPLMLKGINVLAIDMRGHGESAPSLANRVKGRDPKLFNAMHLDVKAAMDFLERKKGCDKTRIGLIGASVGCSVAIDATRRYPGNVRAVVILTPGSKYLGVDSVAHIKAWPGTRIFSFVSTEEKKTSDGVMKALDPFDGSNRMVVPGKGIHGTRMFGKVNQIEELIANFFESSLLKSVDLRVRDGVLLHRRNADMEAWAGAGTKFCEAWVKTPWQGSVVFKFGKKSLRFPLDAKKAEKGGSVKSGDVEGILLSADGRIGVRFPRPARYGETLVIEFKSRKGKGLRLPAKDKFSLQNGGESDE